MNIDSATNCSTSNHRDEINSLVSNSSSFSDFQDQYEFQELINPQNHSLVDFTQSTPKNDSGCEIQYEDSVDEIPRQSQSSLTSDQKYANDLYTLKENIKLQYNVKLGALIKNNKQLKSELGKANEQIERLLRQFGTTSGGSNVDCYYVKLERQNYDLVSQNSILQAKFSQIKAEKDEAEIQLKQLCSELNQYKIDVDLKNAVLTELKNKITKQHAEITRSSKNLYSSTQMFDETNLELENTKKTLQWYKQELYASQGNKKTLLTDLSNCKKEMSLLKETVSNLSIELENTKNKYESFRLQALRERIKLFTTLQICESTATSVNPIESPNGNLLKEYEHNIQDLTNEVARINAFVEAQSTTIEKVTGENSKLLSHCITLQKLLEQKENTVNSLEIEKKHSKMEIKILTSREQQLNQEYNKLKKELINLKTELVMSQQENEIIESTVKTIRNQVSVFKLKHKALKDELSNKNKQISTLQSEKQELFMKNSWQICELEKLAGRDTLISSLKKEIALKEQEIQEYVHEIENLEEAIEKQGVSVSKAIEEMQKLALENKKEIQRYEFVLQQYKDLLLSSEKKVNELRQHYAVNTIRQKTDQDVYPSISLIDSCENLDDDLKSLMKVKYSETSDLVQRNDAKLLEKDSLDSKLRCMTEKAKKLSEKIVQCRKLLKKLFSAMQSKDVAACETIEELRVLLQVKHLEMEEKRKKYEQTNRLLLRKAREHMKAKILAEKRNEQLQECFKVAPVQNVLLESSVENQINDTEKSEKSAFKSEERPLALRHNECLENQKKLETVERSVPILNCAKTQLCEIDGNEHLIGNLRKQVHNLTLENACLVSVNNSEKNKCSELLFEIKNLSDVIKSLEEKLRDENSPIGELSKAFEENSVKELRDKIEFLSNENQILRFSLQTKTEEFEDLEGEILKKQINFDKSAQDSRDLINEMKNHVNVVQSEREATDSEKFFLQRICNDLKLSLKSQTNYSKVLEEKLSHFSQQRPKHFTSLPNILPNSPCFKMYDVQGVNNLLQYKAPVQKIELAEVRGCLDGLRKEIFTLQEQIKKSYNTV